MCCKLVPFDKLWLKTVYLKVRRIAFVNGAVELDRVHVLASVKRTNLN